MKRPPSYVQDALTRQLLQVFSKADLIELVYDFAALSANDLEGERPEDVRATIRKHARAVFRATGRTIPRHLQET